MADPLNLIGGPNGIRTRVTDVRGQCPRPLDDGTTLLIQFQMTNVKFQINSASGQRGEMVQFPRINRRSCLVQINVQLAKNQAIFH